MVSTSVIRSDFVGGRAVQTQMTDLVKELGQLAQANDAWVRLHYVYPYPHVDEIVPLMADGQGAAVSRRAVSTCASACAEGDEAAGVGREEHRAYPCLA